MTRLNIALTVFVFWLVALNGMTVGAGYAYDHADPTDWSYENRTLTFANETEHITLNESENNRFERAAENITTVPTLGDMIAQHVPYGDVFQQQSNAAAKAFAGHLLDLAFLVFVHTAEFGQTLGFTLKGVVPSWVVNTTLQILAYAPFLGVLYAGYTDLKPRL